VHKFIMVLLSVALISGCTSVVHHMTEEPMNSDSGTTGPGTYINDVSMETSIGVNIKKADPLLETSHINVNVYNAVVLLTGEAGSAALKKLAGDTARAHKRVRIVHNELQVRNNASLITRGNDSLITGRVKAKLIFDEEVTANKVKVITEDSTVYLMGEISREMGEKASNRARESSGVRNVVKVFEYTD